MDVLFKTIHGSRLYGLHHENSDYDYYTVVSKVKTAKAKYAKQTITGDTDSMVIDFGTWVGQMQSGVPQALEACFSEQHIIDRIPWFRQGFRVSTGSYERYLRTIKSFALDDDYKKKRHALRLACNMSDIRRYGKFNPTLEPQVIALLNDYANRDSEQVYQHALHIAWHTLDTTTII